MFLGEFKRIFFDRINKILLSFLIILGVLFSFLALFSNSYEEQNGKSETGFYATRKLIKDKETFSGELTPEVFRQVVSLNKNNHNQNKLERTVPVQASEDILSFINKVVTGEDEYDAKAYTKLSPTQIDNLYTQLDKNHKQIEKEYGKTLQMKQYIIKQFKKSSTPLIYEPADSFETMNLYAATYSIILVIVIGFITSRLFSEEFTLRSSSIFFSTRFGQTKAICNKLFVGIVTASFIYLSGIFILSSISFSAMGISGFKTSYLIENPNSIYAITYRQVYLLIILGGFIASLLSAMIAMCVSAKTKSASIATSVPFLLFVVSPFISRLAPNTTFFQLTPDNLINIMNGIKVPFLFQIGNFVFTQTTFIIAFYFLIALFLFPITYNIYKNSNVRT